MYYVVYVKITAYYKVFVGFGSEVCYLLLRYALSLYY